MRVLIGDVNVYWWHDTLTPTTVRVAVYGHDADRWVMLPEVGDVINNFPGYMGDPITVRVTDVKPIGDGCEAYQVTVTDVAP